LNITDFPAYFAPQAYWVNHIFRSITSQQMLVEDTSITLDELVTYKHSTHVEVADHVLDALVAAARESEDALVQEAAEVLAAWDRNTDASSRGALLFIRWFEAYTQQSSLNIFALPFDISDPFNTPAGLADPAGAVAVLRMVAERVVSEYGSLDVSYGEVMRLRLGDYDFPGNGAGDPNGVFRAAWYVPDGRGTYQMMGGDSWVAAIEFSHPIRARVILGPGNATQSGSPHVGDQLALFADKELREAWLTRETIEANLELREVFE
jgi:acyl-homoserine-lactone acylase